MTNFATDEQFARAGRILRKLMYKNTMKPEEKPEGLPYFNYKGGATEPTIGVEGHKMVYIQTGSYMVEPEEIQAIKDIEEIKERDSILFEEDGFKLYVNPEEISSDGVKLFTQKEYEKDVFEREPIWRWRIGDGEPFSEIETLLKNLGIKVTTL